MSALGHKRTSQAVQPMSALPPKADIAEGDHIFQVTCHVGLGESYVYH